MGKRYNRRSTSARPTDANIDSILTEIDTDDRYRYNQYGRWELIPPMSLKTKRIQSIFIPFSNQTGLIFGHGSWQNINAELHSSGCMIYQARTSTSVFNTYSPSAPDSRGFMTVDDVGLTSMLPKMVMIFSWSDTGTNSASFIGFKKVAEYIYFLTVVGCRRMGLTVPPCPKS